MRVELGGVLQRGDACEVARHAAVFDGLDGRPLKALGKVYKLWRSIQLAALGERSGPRKDCGHRVGRGLLSA